MKRDFDLEEVKKLGIDENRQIRDKLEIENVLHQACGEKPKFKVNHSKKIVTVDTNDWHENIRETIEYYWNKNELQEWKLKFK